MNNKDKINKKGMNFDTSKFQLLICAGQTLEPNFNNAEFLKKCKKDKKVKVAFPEIYAQYLGNCMTLTFNGVAVTAYFDGQEHEYPEFVAKYLKKKVEDSMKINVPRNVYSKLY